MGRIRTVKPEMFTHEGLFDLEMKTHLPVRWAFAGLFTCCDREGRFEWRPRRLKSAIMPYDDVDFAVVLDALRREGYVIKYLADGNCLPRVDGASGTRNPRVDDASGTLFYGCIPTWKKHQFINHRESPSVLPPPTSEAVDAANNQLDLNIFDASSTGESRVGHADTAMPGRARVEREREREREREVQYSNNPIDSSKGKDGADPKAAPPSGSRTLISLPLNQKGQSYEIREADEREWQALYPNVDVMQELRNMRGWCDSNPQKRKTRRGIRSFINRWLSEEQDRNPQRGQEHGGNKANGVGTSSGEKRFADIVGTTARACGVAPGRISDDDPEDARAGNRVVEGEP